MRSLPTGSDACKGEEVRRALITGGLGFVGRRLAACLLARGAEVVVLDVFETSPPDGTSLVVTDICDQEAMAGTIRPGDTVFHLAAVKAGMGEADFDLALHVNLDGSRAVLEACRRAGGVRLVYASTLAVFGGELPAVVDEATRPCPDTTYGATKAAVELLVNDYTRKGYVDGRTGRLPTVIVRPDAPSRGTSVFASAIIRETLAGRDYTVPVSRETPVVVIGVETAAEGLALLGDLPPGAFADDRVCNLPGLSATAEELVEGARKAGASGAIRLEPEPAVERVVRSWPRAVLPDRARALGLPEDESVDAIVQDYSNDATLS